MLVIIIAGILRFWQLGEVPPGLYRDEAANGLDALDVVEGRREGQNPFYFAANNGREPLYIYLTALFVGAMGATTEAVRVGAAVIGTLTTVLIYILAEAWFDRRSGILAAWVWAITVWPLHLSRIGLRPILLPLMMVITFWLGTLAYRRSKEGIPERWLWLSSGVAYGISFYTYLAARFTPILLGAIIIYLVLTKKHKALWPGVLWFALGALATLLPMIFLAIQQPELIAGRLDQVSILNPNVTDGSALGSLWKNTWLALGMFVVKGDTIIRHNPPGRALFDIFMLVPFFIGLAWCFRNWRKAAPATLLLWIGVMIGPTILADDAPHFLRAVGVLPAAVMLPAIGLSQIWSWSKLPSHLGKALVVFLALASLGLTIKDYFVDYGTDEVAGYWFEAAARSLAEEINAVPAMGDTYVDRRYLEGWPSVQYLVKSIGDISLYRPDDLQPESIEKPAAIFAWPHERLGSVASAIASPALVTVAEGNLAQGDLEPEPYPLYVRYLISDPAEGPILATFDNTIQLRVAEVTELSDGHLQIDLYWSTADVIDESITSFVHLTEGDTLVAQSDSIPGSGYWPSQWWRPGMTLLDRHILELENDYIEDKQQIIIGLYNASTFEPLAVKDSNGIPIGETLKLR
ncbi:MAG TPA: glycosyltransferase family 39 protein [candidate division Zixibacteria bacterium]|nr:glycosyltransferase family 39 protein [candidate division Zixibacteria bacterium]